MKQTLGLKTQDRIVLGDSQHIEVINVKNISNKGRRLYFEKKASRLFKQSATVGLFEESYLYVRNQSGLYIKVGDKRAEAISE